MRRRLRNWPGTPAVLFLLLAATPPAGQGSMTVPVIPSRVSPTTAAHRRTCGLLRRTAMATCGSARGRGSTASMASCSSHWQISVGTVFEDANGAMWLGGVGEVARIAAGAVQVGRIPIPTQSTWFTVAQSSDGHIWLGSVDRLFRFRATAFDRIGRGASRLSGTEFSLSDGLPKPLRAGNGGSARSPAGDLWFVTDDGIAVIDPNVALTADGETATRLTSVEVDDQAVPVLAGARLGSDASRLRITFRAPRASSASCCWWRRKR